MDRYKTQKKPDKKSGFFLIKTTFELMEDHVKTSGGFGLSDNVQPRVDYFLLDE